jgi:hypothetical protein
MIHATLRGLSAAVLIGSAALAALTMTTTSTLAYDYAWCGLNRGGGSWVCIYSSEAQCRASVSGNGGFCTMNPSAASAQAAEPRRRRK